MQVSMQMILTVCPLIFFASLVDAIAGGGGLISLPAYLLAGLPPVYASGSNKFSAMFGTLTATIKFLRGGKLLLLAAVLAALGAFPGSLLGVELLKRTPEQFVKLFMLVAVPVVAVVILFKRDLPTKMKPLTRGRLAACFVIGLGCGFYDGFFGPGTGTFLIILFTWCVGMDMVTASGTAKFVNLTSNLAALSSFLLSGNVVFPLAVPAMACSVLGGYVGAHLALRKGARLVRYVMLGVLALLIIKLACDYLLPA